MPAHEDRKKRLETYRAKRSADRTLEPFGSAGVGRPGLFVVQQHAARRLHYDLRLEVDGVLRSWAVPKGPSLDPKEKRLAVATEDHPLEYGDFEGVIPKGNYGAGGVIVWDRGLAVHHVDPRQADETGKLLFELKGYKLRGLWTLVKTTRGEKEWLLIKKPDAEAREAGAEDLGAESVLSGLTVEEMRDGTRRVDEIRARLAELGDQLGDRFPVRKHRLVAGKVKPMLAQLTKEPFSKPGWIFELKYDGYRVHAAAACGVAPGRRGEGRLFYRSGKEATSIFPELVRALAGLPYPGLLLDGELVVLDEEARPSFGLLQQRAQLTRPADIEAAAVRLPATLYVFDLLGFDDLDLRPLPLRQRKELLRRVLPAAGPLRFADHVEERGEDLYDEVRRRGLEGIVAKLADAPYRSGRSSAWRKIRAEKTGDFAVIGYTLPTGHRTGFGALHLAALAGGRMVYVGRVGSGFDEKTLRDVRQTLDRHVRDTPAAAGDLPTGKGHVWVDPGLVVEVRYTERTRAGHLRHPVLARLREDKAATECVLEGEPPEGTSATGPGAEAVVATPSAEGRGESRPTPPEEVKVTRPDKIFWPGQGFTKGDLAFYYQEISPWLLPYLRDRPLVLDRFPDGIEGKNFFQKNAPDFAPQWIRTESVWSDEGGNETRYFICDDEQTLAYLVNSGAIPLHVWGSRLGRLQQPDWSILDLDAKEAPFLAAVEVAREIRALCRKIELPCFVKTSGASGLHVLIPLGGAVGFEGSRQLAELLARVVAAALPEIASVARLPASREGKVYIDFLQNGYGKLLVSPFSVRPRPGAPVSMPLRWSEVKPGLDPRSYDIKTAPRRLRRMKKEPLAAVLTTRADLAAALTRLADLV
jgi:bifunctional non-homologous end joining protein LigD